MPGRIRGFDPGRKLLLPGLKPGIQAQRLPQLGELFSIGRQPQPIISESIKSSTNNGQQLAISQLIEALIHNPTLNGATDRFFRRRGPIADISKNSYR